MRPPRAVPVKPERSTPCWAAIRRATGDALAPTPPSPAPPGDAPVSGAPSVWVAAEVVGPVVRVPLPEAALALIRAITCPTLTVSPSSARISAIVPRAGAGSSMSTLSVEISTTVSPCLTASPTLTDHSRIVPSVTDSPPVGVTMSISSPDAASAAASPSAPVPPPAAAAGGGGEPLGLGHRARHGLGRGGGRRFARDWCRGHPRRGHLGAVFGTAFVGRDLGQDRADRDRLALGGVDLHEPARGRRWHLGVDLVGRDLDDRLVGHDAVPLLLVPFEHGAFGDGVTHRRHDNLDSATAYCHLLPLG